MPERNKWEELSRNIIKSELARKGIDYPELSLRLRMMDIYEEATNLNSKINRGKFGFTFFLQCMRAINTSNISLWDGGQNEQ